MVFLYFVLFFKQKTAYEMRISDWSSDVCSSDLRFDRLAEVLGLGAVHYKDESARFGLGSFKPLGGAYAVLHLLAQRLEAALGHPVSLDEIREGRYAEAAAAITVATATDGNHGRSVAWGARLAG